MYTQFAQPPPPGYPYDGAGFMRTPPISPSPTPNYYSPRYSVHTPSPRSSPKVSAHTRRASHSVHNTHAQEASGFNYPSRGPPPSAYNSRYASPGFQQQPPQQFTTRAQPDYVSYDNFYTKSRRYSGDPESYQRFSRDRKHPPTSSGRYFHYVVVDDDYCYDEAPPPYREEYHQSYRNRGADQHYYDQVPIYEAAEPTPRSSQQQQQQQRTRRASHSARPAHSTPKSKPPPPSSKPAPQATEADARRANIPAGYSYKNWDPAEEPILLLGSVFDANSLGKWIYDWTIFVHARASPMSEVAGELWLLLIQLAGKVKRAEELMPKIRKKESREMVEEFLDSGERLWIRFGKLLKTCEDYMWKAESKTTGAKKPTQMGMNSGVEFVDSIFGRDRELEKTEKLMTAMRLWSMRFDANCEEILRHPTA